MPIYSFNEALEHMSWGKQDMDKAIVRFTNFCDIMEKEVKWVRALVRECQEPCLHDLIYRIHEEYEMDMLFGPL